MALAPAVGDGDLDDLFKGPLATFVERRNQLVKRLRNEGRNAEAVTVKALEKPSVPAWAVNQLYWHERAPWDELVEAGQELRRAHEAGDGRALQEAHGRRRSVASLLASQAERRLEESGHGTAAATLQKVARTLEAIAAGGLGDEPPGRLTRELEPPGFEVLSAFPVASARVPPRTSAAAPSPAPAPAAPERSRGAALTGARDDAQVEVRQEAERREARRREEQEAKAREEAERRAALALATRREAMKRQLAELEQELARARTSETEIAAAHERARARRADLERKVAELASTLASIPPDAT